MEKLIKQIKTYAISAGIEPETVLVNAIKCSWGTFKRWEDGTSYPRVDTVDRVRKYMSDNPPAGN